MRTHGTSSYLITYNAQQRQAVAAYGCLYLNPVSAAKQTRRSEGCAAHSAGAASLSECRQSGSSSGRIPSPLRVGVSSRGVEQGLPAAQLWEAILGGVNRTSRSLGAYTERRRSHRGYAGKTLLFAAYGMA